MSEATGGAAGDVAYEQSVNESYLQTLEDRLAQPSALVVPRSRVWVEGGYPSIRDGVPLHPLVARVGMTGGEDVMPASFYIGPVHHRWDGKECFSWAAPVADLFFKPGEECRAAPHGDVVVRRSFGHHVERIVTMHDDWARRDVASPFVTRGLRLPPAPAPSARRPRAVANPAPPATGQRGSQPESLASVGTATREERSGASSSRTGQELQVGMRAPQVVLDRLRSPRSEHLTTVLATLQPDQHALVSARPDLPMIVQGHPGTGKTIVAAYRAAHLTNTDRAGGAVARLLLVGPTRSYVPHVLGLIASLADLRRVHVTSLEDILASVVKVKGFSGGALDGVSDDVDASARGLADRAVRLLAASGGMKNGPSARRENLSAVYELIRTNGTGLGTLSNRPSQVEWMHRLPPYQRAVMLRRYLPLLAQCGLSIQPLPYADTFDHVIVDEAQDVTPIEWNILDQYNRHGHWTLLGDMNQRRTDASYASWNQIAEHLTMGDDSGDVEPTVIRRGYRSTQEILRFADPLLPREQRGSRSLQTGGPEPVVLRVASSDPAVLAGTVVRQAQELLLRHRGGTVALITMDPGGLLPALHAHGWRRLSNSPHVHERSGERLVLHVPESARGLEFDGVVVVEPAAFPGNLGRSGQLYTSLTRANRELVVVHHQALPDPLRKAARR